MNGGRSRSVVFNSAESDHVVEAVEYARSVAPDNEVVIVSPTLSYSSPPDELADRVIVHAGELFQPGLVKRTLARELRIGRGDLVIVPSDTHQTNTHRKLQVAVLMGARRASKVLFTGGGGVSEIRWRNLKLHQYPPRLLFASLIFLFGSILVAREWIRYRIRIRGGRETYP